MKTGMEQHSALEAAMVAEYKRCKNRKEKRQFTKSLTNKERRFLYGQLEYKMMMKQLRGMINEDED